MQLESISILVPVFNNSLSLAELLDRILASLRPLAPQVQVVFVDDKSSDDSLNVLHGLAVRHGEALVLENETNQGQQSSIHKGLSACSGEVVVVMDADLQDPPEAMPDMIAAMQTGHFDAVFAARIGRYQSWSRMVTSHVFRLVMRCMTNLPKGAGGFVAMRSEVAKALANRPKGRFYLSGLIGCGGYKLAGIPVARHWRAEGRSAYTTGMRLSVALTNVLTVINERMAHAGR